MNKPIDLFIIADRELVCEALAAILSSQSDIRVAGHATQLEEATLALEKVNADAVLLNSQKNALTRQWVEHLIGTYPSVRLLILTGQIDTAEIKVGLKMGVMGYLQRDIASQDLYRAIRAVASGQAWAPRDLMTQLIQDRRTFQGLAGRRNLTRRENEVLEHLAQGLTNKQIGVGLNISEKTVKSHLNLVYQKLNISTRAQAAVYAARKHG
ncbi:MAG: response regulator transcription factor [Acidobacteria bacterium]|nr:response regulator transcription factor [Acidobacteriota bacterium]